MNRSKQISNVISSYINDWDHDQHNNQSSMNPAVQFVQSHGLREVHDYKFRKYYAANKDILQLRECPLCPPHKNDSTNLFTLGIFMENGAWNCFRCGNHGNWSTLIRIFNIYGGQQNDYFAFNDNYNDLYNHYNATKNIDGFECVSENEESEIEEISRNDWISEKEIKYQNDLLFQEKPLLNRLIKERNLSSKCFKDYKCGLQYKHFTNFHHKQQCITFPMYQFKNNKFIATKYKTRCVSNGIKQFSQYPVMNESGLFGFDDEVSNNKSSPCVITEGEYDSMAIYYGTDYKVKPVSLPNGANNISNKLIKQLNQVHDNFILFLDWDEVGQRNANLLRDKMIQNNINGNNVQIVGKQDNPHLEDVKDANDIMIKHRKDGHDVMNELLKQYL